MTTRTVVVEVTQAHIDASTKNKCPIALALSRIGLNASCMQKDMEDAITAVKEKVTGRWWVSDKIEEFTTQFRNGLSVQPFTLLLEEDGFDFEPSHFEYPLAYAYAKTEEIREPKRIELNEALTPKPKNNLHKRDGWK